MRPDSAHWGQGETRFFFIEIQICMIGAYSECMTARLGAGGYRRVQNPENPENYNSEKIILRNVCLESVNHYPAE